MASRAQQVARAGGNTRGADDPRREGAARMGALANRSHIATAVRALRPQQWVKNLLLFVPLILAHAFADGARLGATALAVGCFCLCASATYIWNDLFDLEADRQHPRKRERPLASGALSARAGIAWSVAVLAIGLGLSAALLPAASTAMLAVYVAITTAYSAWLKQQLYIDVLVLAGLYTHRVLAGGVAADVTVSPWLLLFSMFFFLSLAFVKRYAELLAAQSRDPGDQQQQLARRGYQVGDISLVETMGLASGYLAVLVIGLYVNSDEVRRYYPTPELLWLMCPVLLYWITRIWFLARRGILPDDPVLFAATDRNSYLAGALVAAIGIAASA
ncbi:MAG: UbiA family prenyltransferase [Proteobacteria bacterium]|nr:UbiA family prenyltransferase [Pseudomonadota bacterium]